MLSAQGLGNDLGHETLQPTSSSSGSASGQGHSQSMNLNPLGMTHVIPFPQIPMSASQFPQYSLPSQYNHVHLEKDCSCASNIPYVSSTPQHFQQYTHYIPRNSSATTSHTQHHGVTTPSVSGSGEVNRTPDVYVATATPQNREGEDNAYAEFLSQASFISSHDFML